MLHRHFHANRRYRSTQRVHPVAAAAAKSRSESDISKLLQLEWEIRPVSCMASLMLLPCPLNPNRGTAFMFLESRFPLEGL
ncbi:UNVERIFIED_CONTAM: hypothetical protein Scaly_0022800 [Sesamum calycinum]|uniref:Uncharacterized protein n=1 Tax=Sesamum calycinum TaxID=2727403 RepID=A0AAW2STY5_9LAMI